MKWTLATAMFGITTVAIPIIPAPDSFPLRLRLQSLNKDIDGQYLSTNGSTVGIFKTESGPLKPLLVYTITDKKTGLVELHTYPKGKDDRLLALVGASSDDLLRLSSLPDPAAIQLPAGSKCDWQSFRMSGGNPPAAGRPGNSVTYAGAKGSWQAFPQGPNDADWYVTFASEGAMIPAINMPIDVVYVPAYDADENGEGLISIQ